MSDNIEGQLSIFDLAQDPNRSATYSFTRYIGQSVQHLSGTTGKIWMIDKYFTYFRDRNGKEWTGTPTTITPLNPELDAKWLADGTVTAWEEWHPWEEGMTYAVNNLTREFVPFTPEGDEETSFIHTALITKDGNTWRAEVYFELWVSGPGDIYKTYKPIKWREV